MWEGNRGIEERGKAGRKKKEKHERRREGGMEGKQIFHPEGFSDSGCLLF